MLEVQQLKQALLAVRVSLLDRGYRTEFVLFKSLLITILGTVLRLDLLISETSACDTARIV